MSLARELLRNESRPRLVMVDTSRQWKWRMFGEVNVDYHMTVNYIMTVYYHLHLQHRLSFSIDY